MNLFTNLRQLTAVLFHEIKYSGNIFLLDKDYLEDKTYTEQEQKDIQDIWLSVYDEYYIKKDSSKFRKSLKEKNKDLDLNCKIVSTQKIIRILIELEVNKEFIHKETFQEVTKSLSLSLHKIDKRLKLDYTKPLEEQIKALNSVLGGLKSRFELQHKSKEDVNLDLMSFYKSKANIEKVLERNLDENVNMLQWLAYEQQYEDKIKQLKGNE